LILGLEDFSKRGIANVFHKWLSEGNKEVLYEFAMTPDLFDASVINSDASARVILVELLRGIADNGLLANLHKDRWLRHISEDRIPTLPPALRDKVQNS